MLVVSAAASSPCWAKKRKKSKTKKAKSELKLVSSCPQTESPKTVWLIKQWHLAPETVTKGFREKYPQEPSQTAIYKFLSNSVQNKDIDLVVGEGCEGEITEKFEKTFNGWNYTSLKAESKGKKYDRLLTHIPLKLEARWTDKVKSYCGDSEAMIREGQIRLSNMRGWYGFLLRFGDSQLAEDHKSELAAAANQLLKHRKPKAVKDLIPEIRTKLKEELASFENSLQKRNDAFIKILSEQDYKSAAVVIGGLHSEDLRSKVEKQGFNCKIYEPPRYPAEDESLIESFRKKI